MGLFPFEWHAADLCAADFNHFQTRFSQAVLQLIPFADGPVTFLDSAGDHAVLLQELDKPKYWQSYIKRAIQRQRSVLASEKPVLFMPIWGAAAIVGLAAVEGVGSQFTSVLSEEWLSDRSRILSREFFLLKQQTLDPVTGMFNGFHLQETLGGLLDGGKWNLRHAGRKGFRHHVSLFLIEIHPRTSNAEKGIHYTVRAGYYLESFLGQDILHHLGSGIFGLIGNDLNEDQAQKLGKNILTWFRREGFSRIYIGINTIELKDATTGDGSESLPACHVVIEQTWQSLCKARRQGPYALCTYNAISKHGVHPLQKTKPGVVAKLKKLWVDADTFALLLIRRDREIQDKVFPKRLLALIESGAGIVSMSDSETFVFLRGANEKQALAWAQALMQKLPGDSNTTYSIGIACFPSIAFKKSDIPDNARKALLHAGFFGPGTITAFDGVSQNVSGDIYYGEGDLVRAVREYKKGLELDPANTNLLNSLGEAYAQMNKPRRAKSYFESVLHTDAKHYMALFNLGVISLTNADDKRAIAYFERALAVYKHETETEQINNLLLQLGKLYCLTGRYKKAVSLLEKVKITEGASSVVPARQTFLRYLGEAYMGSGRNKEAVLVLQRAVRYNPHDAFALSMLGELYGLENQGYDIAHSLCLQAVNIDDRQWKHWYRLALVRYNMAEYESALEALKQCMGLERKQGEPLFLAGKIYEKLGFPVKAAAMFAAVRKITPGYNAAGKAPH